MQSGLQFFDMPINGNGAGKTQKIAIKTEEKQSSPSTSDDSFNAIMNTLMALSPERLETSLKKLEWIPLDDNAGMSAPLIDMSGWENGGDGEKSADSFYALIKTVSRNNVPDLLNSTASETKPSLSLTLNTQSVATGQGAHTPTIEMDAFVRQSQQDMAVDQTHEKTFSLTPGGETIISNHHLEKSNQKIKMTGFEKQVDLHADEMKNMHRRVDMIQNTVATETPQHIKDGAKTSQSLADNMDRTETVFTSNSSENKDKIVPDAQAKKRIQISKTADSSLTKDTNRLTEDAAKQHFTDKPPGIKTNDKKQAAQHQGEPFKAVSDAASTVGEKGVNVINQVSEAPLKEFVRHNIKSVSNPNEGVQSETKPDQVQPNSSIKDPSLSFSSRWSAMLGKDIETINDAKPAETAPDRTDPNDVMRQIVQRMTLKSNRLQSQMNIKLKPEFLGNIRMQITSDNQQVAVRMFADANGVKEIIEQNIQLLKAELQQHGLEIDKFDVFVGRDSDELKQEQHSQLRQRAKEKGEGYSQNKDLESEADDKEPPKENNNAIHQTTSDSEIDYFV